MNISCKCGGNFKNITVEHYVKTRLETKRIENLPANECTICGSVQLSDKSEEVIETIKFLVKREMDRVAKEELEKIEERPYFKNILKRFIG